MRTLLISSLLVALNAHAETVIVKDRGPMDLRPFECQHITKSGAVQRVCYDKREEYMLVQYGEIYYHHCEVPPMVVIGLLEADTMGPYYSSRIKGKFDCGVNRMPIYRRAK